MKDVVGPNEKVVDKTVVLGVSPLPSDEADPVSDLSKDFEEIATDPSQGKKITNVGKDVPSVIPVSEVADTEASN